MVHTFALELLQLFRRPESVTNSQLPPPLLSRRSSPARLSKEVIWCVFCRPSVLFIVLAACSSAVYHSLSLTSSPGHHPLTLDLVALPPSSISPTPTQAPSTAQMLSI